MQPPLRETAHYSSGNMQGTQQMAADKNVVWLAIDSRPTANPAEIATAINHVKVALAETLAGQAVSTAQTRPCGCSVKYSNM